MKINKLLIANRGEIAMRIIRSLKKMNIQSVAVYADNDLNSAHVAMADQAFSLGGGALKDTYLNAGKLIKIAQHCGADAIHPGYGFLSENAGFSQACADAGIVFVGPDPGNIRLMGNKVAARETAKTFGLPVTAGLTGSTETLVANAATLTFPVLVKAAAGGGGKGMRIVHSADALQQVIETTSREALNYFGDGTVYIETFIEEPRHIEIQVLADKHGNVLHLFERECSIQRRYQKIIEESPSPTLTADVRQAMGEAAVKLCQGIGYRNAGTIEFLVDKNMHYYFLEMNTRVQVEHPVTEFVTGIDLVEQQIRIAEGNVLPFSQSDIRQNGHAIECRVYAEDPAKQFMPSPGAIHCYKEPKTPNLRIDSSITGNTVVSGAYDPMISKLIAFGETREAATTLALQSLGEYAIHGIETNLSYLIGILQHPAFIKNEISTGFCDTFTEEILENAKKKRRQANFGRVISAFLLQNLCIEAKENGASIWHQIGYWRHLMQFDVALDDSVFQIVIDEYSKNSVSFVLQGLAYKACLTAVDDGRLSFTVNEQAALAIVSETDSGSLIVQTDRQLFKLRRTDQLNHQADHGQFSDEAGDGSLFAPMPGKVIKVNVKPGMRVERGSILLVVEAMKMENNLVASAAAIVDTVNVKEGEMVDTKTQLVHLKDIEES